MRLEWLGVLKREFFIYKKMFIIRLLFLTLVMGIINFTFKMRESINLLVIFVNILFTLTYFFQLYLQALKDKDIVTLLTLQVSRKAIILGKMAYIIVATNIFNMIYVTIALSGGQPVLLKFWAVNNYITVLIGSIVFCNYLFLSFEQFLKIYQFLRVFIILMIFFLMKLLNITLSSFDPLYHLSGILY